MRQLRLIRPLLLFAFVGTLSLLCSHAALAASQIGKPHVATNIDDADADYAFQGEYLGTLGYVGGGPWQTFGLQVAAVGDGDYIAVEYPGGLPGKGWYGGEKAYLRGRREPDRLTLRGDGRRYDVIDGIAWYVDYNGDKLTWLTKVNRQSRSLGAPPPANAIVLFDGLKTDQLVNVRVTSDGLLKEGARTKDAWQDYFLHVEFQLSYMPFARQQGRSNSGVYLQRSYEIQILDSFALEGFPNECGAIYRYRTRRSTCVSRLWPGRPTISISNRLGSTCMARKRRMRTSRFGRTDMRFRSKFPLPERRVTANPKRRSCCQSSSKIMATRCGFVTSGWS